MPAFIPIATSAREPYRDGNPAITGNPGSYDDRMARRAGSGSPRNVYASSGRPGIDDSDRRSNGAGLPANTYSERDIDQHVLQRKLTRCIPSLSQQTGADHPTANILARDLAPGPAPVLARELGPLLLDAHRLTLHPVVADLVPRLQNAKPIPVSQAALEDPQSTLIQMTSRRTIVTRSTLADLEDCFGQFGKITHLEIKVGFAFIEYEGQDSARYAIDTYNEGHFLGAQIKVEASKSNTTQKGAIEANTCFTCGDSGHYARVCPKDPRNEARLAAMERARLRGEVWDEDRHRKRGRNGRNDQGSGDYGDYRDRGRDRHYGDHDRDYRMFPPGMPPYGYPYGFPEGAGPRGMPPPFGYPMPPMPHMMGYPPPAFFPYPPPDGSGSMPPHSPPAAGASAATGSSRNRDKDSVNGDDDRDSDAGDDRDNEGDRVGHRAPSAARSSGQDPRYGPPPGYPGYPYPPPFAYGMPPGYPYQGYPPVVPPGYPYPPQPRGPSASEKDDSNKDKNDDDDNRGRSESAGLRTARNGTSDRGGSVRDGSVDRNAAYPPMYAYGHMPPVGRGPPYGEPMPPYGYPYDPARQTGERPPPRQ
ncbi:hypothetical protein EMMF5_006402 [Cystobasidiomycetes sp. EMM_F5]